MTKALEFRSRAEQFRQLAAQFPNGEYREIILSLAITWENLADDRERLGPRRVVDSPAADPAVLAKVNDPGLECEVPTSKPHDAGLRANGQAIGQDNKDALEP